MKRWLASALAVIGISNTAAADPKVQSIDPKSILFSVPTLSDDLAPLAQFDGKPKSTDFAFHEDDWCQIEFLRRRQLESLQRMMREYKSFEVANRAQYGWRNVYVRKIERTALLPGPNAVHDLEALLKSQVGPAPVLFSASSITGQVVGGFSMRLGGDITLYGYADQSGIPVLGALVGANPDDQVLIRAFSKLSAERELVLVDWRQQLILISVSPDGQLNAWRP